jgi:acyl-CoA thioesterase
MSTPDLAARCAAKLWAEDACSRGLGMVIAEVAAGRAVLEMTVDARMVNGHGTCHGGMIFTLADTAFGFACNSYNAVTVAQHCSVTFLTPARHGDRLRAEAVERSNAGRSGIYDVTVTNQDGTVVAEFRGLGRTLQGRLIDVD